MASAVAPRFSAATWPLTCAQLIKSMTSRGLNACGMDVVMNSARVALFDTYKRDISNGVGRVPDATPSSLVKEYWIHTVPPVTLIHKSQFAIDGTLEGSEHGGSTGWPPLYATQWTLIS
ncbi:hypothetical protein JVU11DRAFT_4527 [Chiua virens]|nr:hypothetical protein JVU11DRAFT_4527 [Chiua virens]